MRVLCGSLEHLPVAFAELEAESLSPLPLRDNRRARLIRRVRAMVKTLDQPGEAAPQIPSPPATNPLLDAPATVS